MSLFSARGVAGLLRRLLTGGLSHAVRSAQDYLKGSLGILVENAIVQARRLAITYAFGAALSIVAVFYLCAAFSEGLMALGLPAWASYLVVAASTAILSWVFFRRAGARRSNRKARPPAPEEESESRGSGVTIKFVNERPRPRARSRKKRAKPRPKRRVIDVHPGAKGWEVTSSRSRPKKRIFATQQKAVKAAMSAARKQSADLLIRGAGGRLRRLSRLKGVA